jgi:hypothetical protein
VTEQHNYLEVYLNGWSHGGLHVHGTNVLPLLFKEGSKKVSSKLGVNDNLFLFLTNVSDRHVEA